MATKASLVSMVLRKRATLVKAEAHLDRARRSYRAALLEASHGGVTVTALADATDSSWSRVNQHLTKAATEARISLTDSQLAG